MKASCELNDPDDPNRLTGQIDPDCLMLRLDPPLPGSFLFT